MGGECEAIAFGRKDFENASIGWMELREVLVRSPFKFLELRSEIANSKAALLYAS